MPAGTATVVARIWPTSGVLLESIVLDLPLVEIRKHRTSELARYLSKLLFSSYLAKAVSTFWKALLSNSASFWPQLS